MTFTGKTFVLDFWNTQGTMKYDDNQCVEDYYSFLRNDRSVTRKAEIEVAAFPILTKKTLRLDMNGYHSFDQHLYFDVLEVCIPFEENTKRYVYYYVDSINWKANKVLELELTLDVLNTYSGDPSYSSSYLFNYLGEKTMIMREHKSRVQYWNYDSSATPALEMTFKVDKIPEGFGNCAKYQVSSSEVLDSRFNVSDAQPWSVYYGKVTDDTDSYVLSFNPSRTAVTVKNGSSTLYINRASVFKTEYSGATKIIEYPYLPFFNVEYDSSTKAYNVSHPSGQSVIYYNNEHSTTTTAPYDYLVENAHSFAIDLATANYGTLRQSYVTINTRQFPLFYQGITAPDVTNDRMIVDPKVYHSDFYAPQFVYGDSSFVCQMEKITPLSSTKIPAFTIGFAASTSPVSTFGFKFFPTNMTEYATTNAYETVMMITRNNEKTLYTDDYLNYLRTGYNYSLASKATNTLSSIINTATMGAIGAATGNVGMEVGAVSSMVNISASVIQGYISEENKKAQLAARAVGASGSDSLEVFSALCGNHLNYEVYRVSDEVKKMLDDFFYYYGYKCGYQGIPDIDSRYWWNFLQCTPKWKKKTYAYTGIPKDHLDIIERKLEEGVTIFHNQGDSWDIEQRKENWESAIAKVLPG